MSPYQEKYEKKWTERDVYAIAQICVLFISAYYLLYLPNTKTAETLVTKENVADHRFCKKA
jgi:hypothetical protein